MKDSKSPEYDGPCMWCGGPVPNADEPGKYPGALSRTDNETYICSGCGTKEALAGFYRDGSVVIHPNPGVLDALALAQHTGGVQ